MGTKYMTEPEKNKRKLEIIMTYSATKIKQKPFLLVTTKKCCSTNSCYILLEKSRFLPSNACMENHVSAVFLHELSY